MRTNRGAGPPRPPRTPTPPATMPDLPGVEFRAEGSPRRVSVIVDGQPQSYVNLDDPSDLGFEYLEHSAAVIDTLDPPPPAPLAVTHVGGAGLTLARYVQHTRPDSPQIVLEPAAAVTEAVRARLPLPRGHRVRVRAVDGRGGLAALREASADLVVLDAYAGGRVPADLTTVEWFRDVRRVLRPEGALLANLADEPDWRYLARVLAAVRSAGLPHVVLVALPEVSKRRRYGNVVLLATSEPRDVEGLRRVLGRSARSAYPAMVAAGGDVEGLARGALPLTDADGMRSPAPPDPGRWRVR